MLHDDARAEGLFVADGIVIAYSGVAIPQAVDSSTTASALTNLAVALRPGGVVAGKKAAGVDDTQGVIGIAMGYDDPTKSVSVVFSGLAVATLSGNSTAPSPGAWLVLDGTSAGMLMVAPAAPLPGTLVAKFIAMQGATTMQVLVSLG